MTPFETARDLVLLVLGLFGAGLSLFNYLDARRKDRRALKVTLGSAMPFDGATLGASFVRVTATNVGPRSVTLVHLGLELVGGSRLASLDIDPMPGMPDTRLPVTMADGQQAQVHLSYNEIGRSLLQSGKTSRIKLTAVGEDSSGKRHIGDSWTIDPHEWAAMR